MSQRSVSLNTAGVRSHHLPLTNDEGKARKCTRNVFPIPVCLCGNRMHIWGNNVSKLPIKTTWDLLYDINLCSAVSQLFVSTQSSPVLPFLGTCKGRGCILHADLPLPSCEDPHPLGWMEKLPHLARAKVPSSVGNNTGKVWQNFACVFWMSKVWREVMCLKKQFVISVQARECSDFLFPSKKKKKSNPKH